MTIAETLQQKLGDWKPVGEDRHWLSIDLGHNDWVISIEADRVESLGTLFHQIDLHQTPSKQLTPDVLENASRSIANRVTGLLEDLKLIEIDQLKGIAIIRSDKPKNRDDHVEFYQLTLTKDNHIAIQRFKASRHSPAHREQIHFALTHEVVAKMIEDIVTF